jgi:uncharacterized protein (TIGR00369 family)
LKAHPDETRRAEAVSAAIVSSPFGRRLGAQTLEVERDRVVVRLPFAEANATVGDMVHGGAIASLIDIAATGAAWSGVDVTANYRGTTIGLSISYLSAARACDLRAEARVRRRGKSVCFVDVAVCDGEGNEVATAQVTYKLTAIEARRPSSPAEVLAGLFAGKSTAEQQALLATLERSGALLYEQWARTATSEDSRRNLLEAARRELENAETLEARLS